MFPQFLYRLTPRDQQVTPLEIFTERLSSTASGVSATLSTATYIVPKGKILLLQNAVCRSTSDSTHFPQQSSIFMDPVTTAPAVSIARSGYPYLDNTGQRGVWLNWTGGIYIPESWEIYAQTVFDIADIDNSVDCHFTGILIPRGNFAV